jgi:HEAT repeat protein
MQAMSDDLDGQLRMALNPVGGDAEGRIRERAIQYLLQHAGAAYPRLIGALESAPFGLNAPALMELLPRFKRPESIPILARILASGQESVARAAGQALGYTEGDEAEQVLTEALSSSNPETVIGAADGFFIRGEKTPCPALLKAVRHSDANVRYHVLQAALRLECLDAEEREHLLHDADPSIRQLAETSARRVTK